MTPECLTENWKEEIVKNIKNARKEKIYDTYFENIEGDIEKYLEKCKTGEEFIRLVLDLIEEKFLQHTQ